MIHYAPRYREMEWDYSVPYAVTHHIVRIRIQEPWGKQ